jgi:quercetin dioxygenase-like cupin family protein
MTVAEQKNPPIRRVVTGHSQQKVAKVFRDDFAANVGHRPKASSTTIWCSDGVPVRMDTCEGGPDLGARMITTGTPPNGTRFMVMDLFPGCEGALHRTDTLDYVIVMEGEVEMRMDESTVTLRAGDVLVQQATNHAWANRTSRHARLGIVLVDAESLGEGYPPGRKEPSEQSKS